MVRHRGSGWASHISETGKVFMNKVEKIAPQVVRVTTGSSNAYILGDAQRWILVDSGAPGSAKTILRAVSEYLGPSATPAAILLTHGHFDISGSALELARRWSVRIHVHKLELPFVNGTSCYPPVDPAVGGFLARLMRFAPNTKIDLSPHVRALTIQELPWMGGWRIIATPGHSPGHISLFRPSDRTLIAGDAITTLNQDSAMAIFSRTPQVLRPPAAFTCDWHAAAQSVHRLAELNPQVLAPAHGLPTSGEEALQQLKQLAENFPVPSYGRYVSEPARTDENGITYLPPPVPDHSKRTAILSATAAGAVAAGIWLKSRRGKRRHPEPGWEEVA